MKLIELVDLTEWKKQKDIILELYKKYNITISSRTWRSQVEKWNKSWGEGNVNYCISHSPQLGFKASNRFQDVIVGINDYNSRIKKMSISKNNLLRGFIRSLNLKLNLETGDVI